MTFGDPSRLFSGSLFFFGRRKNGLSGDPELLCKFVYDSSGTQLGESVSFMEDVLIVKDGSRFLGVPMKHVHKNQSSLVVKGIYDLSKAYALGEKWRIETRREMPSYDKDRAP